MNNNHLVEKLKGYNRKKILVTGRAGFIGSNIVRRLLEFDADVTVLDDLFSGSEINLKGLNNVSFIKGDIRNKKLIDEIINAFEYVFHLAARNIIVSTKNPTEDFEVNIGGTLNLLMSLRESKNINKFVF